MQENKTELKVFDERIVLEKEFRMYGSPEEPLFLAKDVAIWIEHSDVSTMIRKVDSDEKVTNIVCTPGGNQEAWFLTENGLYEVLMQSRKPIAKAFKKEVKEILKSVRKHGVYMTPQKIEEVLCNPDTIIELATILKEEQEQRKLLEAKIELDRPKVEFAEALEVSPSCISIGDLAKLLHQNGVDIGRNRLFEWLRENGYLMKNVQRGLKNVPTQKAREMKLFEVEATVHYEHGEPVESSTTVVTTKGQKYFLDLFLRNK